MRVPRPITCRWCEQSFPTEAARREHSATCHVKARVQFVERQGGRPLRWDEVRAVRDRARKEIAMEREA